MTALNCMFKFIQYLTGDLDHETGMRPYEPIAQPGAQLSNFLGSIQLFFLVQKSM